MTGNRGSSDLQSTDADNFINALSQTLAAANAFLSALLRESGLVKLVPSHGEILMQLFAKNAVTMQELATSIGRDPSTVTSLVRKLVDAGYVEAHKSPSDKRMTIVSLSPAGRKMRADFSSISEKLRSVQMEGIDIRAFETTCGVLDNIRGNFKAKLNDNGTEEGGRR